GMSNHISNLRIKEMSLRRLFGASVKENFQTMVKSFFILTLICNLISIPISVIISNAWLRQFSFHITFTYLNVLITFFVSLLVLLIAISGNMLKTVNKPVVEGLKERE
ncbi:MAG: FtsX-like permease family protein, partial [Bacteroidales bacterium]|nr:FtsX-like permease family protein [Bacteroidales bacterium]